MSRTPRTPRPARILVSVDEAAKFCGVHRQTIRRRIADGSLTGYRVGPRYIRVDQAEVEELLKPIPATGHYGGRPVSRRAAALAEQAEAAGNGA